MKKTPSEGHSVQQNIMFRKDLYTIRQAEKFMEDHGYKPIKDVDISENYYRYRLTRNWKKGVTYRTIELKPGILSAIAYRT
jgi:hypothetical protein